MGSKKSVELAVVAKPSLNYQIVKNVAVPSISMKSRDTFTFMSLGPIHTGEPLTDIDKRTGEMVTQKPATFMRVTDLESGKMHNFMVPTVLESILNREYDFLTGDGKPGYVGKCFVAVKSRREGKKYDDYALDEISLIREDSIDLELLKDQAD